jgi:hypothetical protein
VGQSSIAKIQVFSTVSNRTLNLTYGTQRASKNKKKILGDRVYGQNGNM